NAVGAGEGLVVARRHDIPLFDFILEDLQLFDQDRRLNSIEPRIITDMNMLITVGALAMHAQRQQQVSDALIVCKHSATIAIATQRLCGEKTGCGRVADRTGAPAVEQTTKALRRVAEKF